MIIKRHNIQFQILSILPFAVTIFFLLPSLSYADSPPSRYFYSGDGTIYLINQKNGATFNGRYRADDGTYLKEALKEIHSVFDSEYGNPLSAISLRLIEFLDFLVDTLRPESKITVASGWRSPEYNKKLREEGKLAATASLHQYGMAADICVEGVHPEYIWNYIKKLGFGGVGYYHGKLVHVDVGPPRSWDETSSGVGTGISDDNKLIGIITDRDIYLPGEIITLRFIRMTAFPIGVLGRFILERVDEKGDVQMIVMFSPSFKKEADHLCIKLYTIGQMMGITWKLPPHLDAGYYRMHSFLCKEQWEDMPTYITTPLFEIRQP